MLCWESCKTRMEVFLHMFRKLHYSVPKFHCQCSCAGFEQFFSIFIMFSFHIHTTQHNRRYLSKRSGRTSQSTVSDVLMRVSSCNISLRVLFSRTGNSYTYRSLRISQFISPNPIPMSCDTSCKIRDANVIRLWQVYTWTSFHAD